MFRIFRYFHSWFHLRLGVLSEKALFSISFSRRNIVCKAEAYIWDRGVEITVNTIALNLGLSLMKKYEKEHSYCIGGFALEKKPQKSIKHQR